MSKFGTFMKRTWQAWVVAVACLAMVISGICIAVVPSRAADLADNLKPAITLDFSDMTFIYTVDNNIRAQSLNEYWSMYYSGGNYTPSGDVRKLVYNYHSVEDAWTAMNNFLNTNVPWSYVALDGGKSVAITLYRDFTPASGEFDLRCTASINREILLDLNGYTIGGTLNVRWGDEITIKDTSADQTGTITAVDAKTGNGAGFITVESGCISSYIKSSAGMNILINGGRVGYLTFSSLTAQINGGTIVGADLDGVHTAVVVTGGAGLKINGGAVYGHINKDGFPQLATQINTDQMVVTMDEDDPTIYVSIIDKDLLPADIPAEENSGANTDNTDNTSSTLTNPDNGNNFPVVPVAIGGGVSVVAVAALIVGVVVHNKRR